MNLVRQVQASEKNPSRDSENEQIRILFERHKEQILADCRERFRNTSSKPTMIEEVIQKLNGIIESQRSEINHALAGDEQLRSWTITVTKSGSS